MIARYLHRSFFKAFFLSSTLLLLALNGVAQKKLPYTLLWQISGKGLSKPSYLFGSLVLKDSRGFNFSDSVFKAIEASTAFVVEEHPDSAANNLFYLINQSTANTINSLPKSYSLTTLDLKQTAAKAYLYGIARTLNKKILALDGSTKNQAVDENAEDVVEAVEEDEQNGLQEEMESILTAYQNGNLDEVWKKIQYYYEEDETSAGNVKELFNRISKLLATEQVFGVFNFPALAGNEGLVALFKNAGYTVRPVEASFTAVGQGYVVDLGKMQRYTYQDQQANYSVSFPSAPLSSAGNRSAIKTYHDPLNGVIYTSTSLYTGPLTGFTSAQYADSALANYLRLSKMELVKKNPINKFGASILEVTLKGEHKHAKTWLLHTNGTFYSFTAEHKLDLLTDPYIDLFFNSIQISEPKAITSSNWIDYKHKIGAFSIKIPVQPQEMIQDVASEVNGGAYKLNIYMSTDKVNLMNYLVRYNDFPEGLYLDKKAVVFDAMLTDFTKKGQIIGQPKVVAKDGYEGRSYEMISNGSYIEVQIFIRGNRTYLLLRQNMNGTSKPTKTDQFFSSFKFDPYQSAGKVSYAIGHTTFIMPSQPTLAKTEKEEGETEDDKHSSFLSGEMVHTALNGNTGASYVVARSTVSKYFKSKNIDTLMGVLIEKLKPQHSAAKVIATDFKLGTITGKEMVAVDTLSGSTRKTRIWFNEGFFYYQFLIATKEEIESEAAQRFFNLTEVKEQAATFDMTSSKAKLITTDLLSEDPETYKAAHGALSYYTFDKEELPIIYAALNHKYTDDTTSTGTRASLLEFLNDINDKQTPDFLKKLYQDNKGADLIQSNILSVLPKIDSTSYDWYFKALTTAPTFKLKNYWPLFTPLRDSVSYTSAHIDQVLKLMQVQEYRSSLLGIISQMVNMDGAPYKALIESKKELISKNMMKDLEDDIVLIKADEYPSTVYSYLNILPTLNLPQLTDIYTNKIIALDSVPYLRTTAFATRIVAGLSLDPQLLSVQLDSLSSRYNIMYAFNKVGKLATIPLKYRKHEEFAKLLLYNYLDEEYAYPEEIKLLGNIKEGQQTYYVFDFSYTEEGVKKTYVGVCGPFNSKAETLDFDTYTSYSTFETKEKDWLKQAKLMVKEIKSEQ